MDALQPTVELAAGARGLRVGGEAVASRDALLEPILGELLEFEHRLEAAVASDLGPMAEAMRHIVRAGGKRIRPALVILSAQLGRPLPDHVYDLAMGIEFIHTATLVHDDLIDRAPTRRGMTTIHEKMGSAPAIIVGDYYFAKGANLIASIGEPAIDAAISNTVMTICLGELLQMTSKDDYGQSLEAYHRKIERKTATLLATCCFCGGAVGRLDTPHLAALRTYGHNLGMAFQIADDLLDYVATEEELGKPVGADLRQGTVTLPFMLALQEPGVGEQLVQVIDHQPLSDGDYETIVRLVRKSGAIAATEHAAQGFAAAARAGLAIFPASPARVTLEAACDYVVDRRI
ncbi:MAG: polyprenyl synthetase family protein [Candidatus Dormiibacterota bacterium]